MQEIVEMEDAVLPDGLQCDIQEILRAFRQGHGNAVKFLLQFRNDLLDIPFYQLYISDFVQSNILQTVFVRSWVQLNTDDFFGV